jgi:hypothetical protein
MLLLIFDVSSALVGAVVVAVGSCWLWDIMRPRRR